MDADGKKQKVNADSEIRYTWKQKGNKRTLFLNEIKIELKIDGAEIMNSTMNREKFRFKGQEKENVDFSFESAPEQMKKMLKDSFGAQICWLEVDKNGREVKRTIVAGPGAKATIEQGMIANTLLFHPPFFHDKDNWECEREVSGGNGVIVKGDLSYKKTASQKGKQTVKVSGTLKNEGFRPPGAPATTQGVNKVIGEQSFDLAQNEWTAGKLSMEVSIEVTAEEKVIGSGKGTILVTLEEVSDKNDTMK
jgi:hypothetical protein